MSTHRKVDPSTLGWVKSEIDETLKQARLALEGFVENPSDRGRLRFCITHLHQVVGTLLMVELDGAALLAREVEALAEALYEEKAPASQEALEALTRGILVLPDYLARLQHGHPDLPLTQLALLNELRAARQAAPVAEIELFNPDLSVRPPPLPGRERVADADYAALARQQRATYQAALLAWLRDSSAKEPLVTIAQVLETLQLRASAPALEQLFWVAGGLLEGMIAGELEPTPERKKHLARIDQQIKKIVDGTERSVLRSSSEAVTKAILFDLARSAAATPKIAQLRQAFGLNELLGEPAGDPDAALKPSPEVLQSVGAVLGKEIEQAQDLLAAAFEAHKTDAASLEPLVSILRRMAGTAEVAEAAPLKALIDEIVAALVALGEGRIAPPDVAAMPLAQALLVLESSAREIHRPAADWRRQIEQCMRVLQALQNGDAPPSAHGIEVSDATLTEAEYQQLVGVVANEVGVNLARIEEAIEGFAAHPEQIERLDDVPRQLEQIQGAMQILGIERAVELATTTRRYIEDLRRGALTAHAALLDGIAFCVGTLGAYMDGLKAGRRNLDQLVDAALREIEAAAHARETAPAPAGDPIGRLRARLEAWLGASADDGLRTALREALADIAGLPSRDPARTRRIVDEIGRLLDLVATDSTELSEEAVATLRASCDALAAQLSEPARAATTAPARAAAPSTPPPQAPKPAEPAQEVDPEILEIFIEDARDVYGNITREFAAWRADPGNQQALAELRRGYHTLKGSGRMVGATAIAELAWAIEHMLNLVRDGKLEPSPAVFAVVEESQAVLPDMIAQLEGGPAPAVDVAAIAARAHELAGRRPEASSSPAAPAPSDVPAEAAGSATMALPKLDGVLLDIFTNEAHGHLANIREHIERCRDAGASCLVTPGLTRSIHTLQGNARSLGIPLMAEACATAERLLHALQVQQLPLVAEHLDLLEEFADIVADLVEAVAQGGESADLGGRFASLTERLQAECDKNEVPDAPAVPLGEIPVTELEPEPEPDFPLIGERLSEPPPIEAAVPRPASSSAEPPSAPHGDAASDPELYEIFREEATDILDDVERALRAWRAEPDNAAALLELKRALHTLKGGARMAGAMRMGEVSHQTETLLMQVENRTVLPNAALFDLLEEAHDVLVSLLNGRRPGQEPPDVEGLLARLATASAPRASTPPAAAPEPAETPETTAKESATPALLHPVEETPRATPAPAPAPAEEPADADRSAGEPEVWTERRERPGQIRVSTDLLNTLVNYAGEVSIARARMEQQIHGFRDNLAELQRNALRFREQLRELEIQSESQILYRLERGDTGAQEFDPLEFDRYSKLQQLTRSLTESLHDLTTIQMNMGNFVGEAEAVLQQQARLNTELQEGLMRTRMVEFATQAARLRHIARQTARELGKRAELDIKGGEVQIDRTVLERMIGPFEHMIRNSLDHGIEPEAERVRRGKPPVGRIVIEAKQEGNEIVIRFSDDGAGMNAERIRAKAIERGLLAPDANVSEDNLLQFVLLPGFSTATEITHVSGRGVGMDVVHSEVKQLGGTMAVDTEPGRGTTFIIRLPLTLSITQALTVYVGEQQFAVPLGAVSNIIECTPEQLSRIAVGKNPLLSHGDKLYPFMNLGARLGIPSAGREGRKIPVLLARAGNREVAIQVDGLGGTREIVIKALGPQLAAIKGLAGATIMGDGRVVLILDIAGLWYAEEALQVEHQQRPAAPAPETRTRPVVMVVDDSLTVRKVTSKHLQKRGFDVMVAKDGLDAVEQLRSRVPDLMLVDIEMPRMDGYELTGRVRADAALKHIPIIMITSRAGEKHRNRAFELGVDIYMSKPYQEDDLFRNIEKLLARGRARA